MGLGPAGGNPPDGARFPDLPAPALAADAAITAMTRRTQLPPTAHGMATGANDSWGATASADWVKSPGSQVSFRRIIVTVSLCTRGHRAWVAL
jgi:hypothetical protein